jgi:hypothetical protein
MSGLTAEAGRPRGFSGEGGGSTELDQRSAPYGPTLLLTVTLAFAGFMVLMPLVLLVIHPNTANLGSFAKYVNQQNQNAKTAIYLASFVVILPLALIAGPRLADTVRRGPNPAAVPAVSAILAATLTVTLVAIRLSTHLPWGDGMGVVLTAAAIWWAIAALILAMATRRPWPLLSRLRLSRDITAGVLWVALFAAVLVVTHVSKLQILPLVLGAALVVAVVGLHDRWRPPKLTRWQGIAIDVVIILIILLAVPDTVIFHASPGLPSSVFEPGITQFQQDWIIGPANQLLGGGALLVNSPASQYGVGMVYFVAGWFHLVPIGYGTFGLLDGILTALFYAAAYCVLRAAGVRRLLAGSALALGVVAFVYNLLYLVGALPEQGPLRFGPPMALIVFTVAAARWPQRAKLARAAALVVLGVASIWALEAFAYAAFTFLAMAALEAWLRTPGSRLRWALRQLALGLAACVCAHLLFAGATLAGTGQLPDWGQYLAFIHELLLGGREGSITYGFDHWSPGLGLGAACLASAAALVLLVRRVPAIAAQERPRLIALAGTTAYAIAVFSYTDNRSSTYLLLYVSLPMLMAGTLWLDLLLRAGHHVARGIRLGALGFALSIAVLLVAAAWPAVGSHFSRSALAHAYPGGGLSAALHRLSHPPPLDPRAPAGQRLLARYMPGRRALVVLPGEDDLAIEILMRSRRTNSLFIGDPNMDGFVPSVWIPKITRQIAQLRPGDRILTDHTASTVIAILRAHPEIDPLTQFVAPGAPQLNWILREIDKRFVMRPLATDPSGLVVAELESRR